MSTVINLEGFRPPVQLPAPIRNAKTWLVWRLVHIPGDKKPKKMPYYAATGFARGRPHGEGEGKLEVAQGDPEDVANLVSFDRAAAAVIKGRYTGVGLAMLPGNGLVALDFDDCIDADGNILPQVEALIEGTYSEISPSGNGIRAFFSGAVRDRKDHNKPDKTTGKRAHAFGVEFFHGAGYVTVTGNQTPACEMWGYGDTVLPLTDAVKSLYRERFGDDGTTSAESGDWFESGDWLATLTPKVGLTLDKARAFINALDADGGYDDWVKAGQSLHHEFDGSEAALALWVEWSKKSDDKYPGDRALEAKWASFGRYRGAPITAAWLLKHSKVARVASRYEAFDEWKQRIVDAPNDRELKETIAPGIAADDRLGEIERESLVHELIARFKAFGTKLTLPVVRKLCAPPNTKPPTVTQSRPLTEFGMAERMLDRYHDSLMYVPETNQWYVWTGVYWRWAVDVEIEHFAKETVRELPDEAAAHGDAAEFYGFCAIAQQARMVRNMVMLAASDPRVMVSAANLDAEKYLLGVRNGIVDLRTGKLLPPDPGRRITRVCRCEYRPGAGASLWRKTVLDVFSDDQELAAFFQRLIGYTSLGTPTEDIMVIAHGNGSNGKSTVFGTVRKVLGGYARSADSTTFLTDTKGGSGPGGPREDLMRLQGARFVYVNEPDENGELREGMVKSMTGGDAITARGMHAKRSIEFEPSWVVCMPTNHKPIVKGSDHGIWRRLLMLPFLRNFDTDPTVVKDDKREEKLEQEAEGVLAWIVEGAQLYLADGLSPPGAVRAAREQYRSQMDLLAEWIDDRCEQGAGLAEQMQRLWMSWEEYARERGILQYVRSSVALGRRLDQRFPGFKGTGGTRMRSGLKLKTGDLYADDFFAD